MAGLDRADCFAAPRASGAESCGALAIHVADDRRNFFGLQMAHLLGRTKPNRPCPGWSRSGLFLSVARDGRGKISRPDPRAKNLTALSRQVLRGRTSEVRGAREQMAVALLSEELSGNMPDRRGEDVRSPL